MAQWIDRLKTRWNLQNTWQVVIILIVFTCTGFTVAGINRPILNYFFEGAPIPWWAYVIYLIFILPIYNILLLAYGFVFGQFTFFWNFEKRFFSRIISRFKSNDPSSQYSICESVPIHIHFCSDTLLLLNPKVYLLLRPL